MITGCEPFTELNHLMKKTTEHFWPHKMIAIHIASKCWKLSPGALSCHDALQSGFLHIFQRTIIGHAISIQVMCKVFIAEMITHSIQHRTCCHLLGSAAMMSHLASHFPGPSFPYNWLVILFMVQVEQKASTCTHAPLRNSMFGKPRQGMTRQTPSIRQPG